MYKSNKYYCMYYHITAIIIVLLKLVLVKSDQNIQTKHVENIENHPHFKLLPKDCGRSYSDRIVGGKEANLGQYPWLAKLGYKIPHCTKETFYRCAGTLINRLYVISAGHCVVNLPEANCGEVNRTYVFARIVLGDYNMETNPDCKQGICAAPFQIFKPMKILLHIRYNKPRFANDISLIRLNRPARLNGWTTPICLPRGNQLDELYLGKYGEVAGWGTTSSDDLAGSNILMFVKLRIVDVEQCTRSFKYPLILNRTLQMCAGGAESKDSCDGDSGAPFMYAEIVNGSPRYIALGVVSFGSKRCGRKDKPAVYTRLAGYMRWILNNIEP